jgi:release factor glutamine methyltransferase
MLVTVRELLRDASDKLRSVGVDTPRLDATVLLSLVTGRSRVELLTNPDFIPVAESIQVYLNLIERRFKREPLAYITGEREFYGIPFHVTPDVLIPRPETEILVETAISFLKSLKSQRAGDGKAQSSSPADAGVIVVDIGTGSGVIAVSVARNVQDALVYATDSSRSALKIARENAERAGVSDRIRFIAGDMFDPLEGQTFDLVLSNPPYIPTDEIDALEPEVSVFEPRQALDGGADGLDCYRIIARGVPMVLKPSDAVMVEVGAGQASEVAGLFAANGLENMRIVKDYAGIDRVVVAQRRS